MLVYSENILHMPVENYSLALYASQKWQRICCYYNANSIIITISSCFMVATKEQKGSQFLFWETTYSYPQAVCNNCFWVNNCSWKASFVFIPLFTVWFSDRYGVEFWTVLLFRKSWTKCYIAKQRWYIKKDKPQLHQ